MTDDSPTADLVISAGRVICAETPWDAPGDVVVRDGRVVEITAEFAGRSRQRLSYPDGLALPGLVDLHAHPAESRSVFGVSPDRFLLPRGVSTVLSQGDAGADNVDAFVAETIEPSLTRVVLAINLSRRGESTAAGCFADLADADVDRCVAAIERHRRHIWGIAVNASHHACESTDPREVLQRGLQAAERAGLPLLYGMRRPEDWPLVDQLNRLRRGDVVTYCFRRQPHCIIQNGRVMAAVIDARERGVLFDVGHGMASFSFAVAESCLASGFSPDTISTDSQIAHAQTQPEHSLPLVMSKLVAAGMPIEDAVRAATIRPAQILGLEGVGTLRAGSPADLVVLQRSAVDEAMFDAHGEMRQGLSWNVSAVISAGGVVV